MSQLYELIIYEPQKDTRTVNFCVDPKDIENNCNPVFNEDGTIQHNFKIFNDTKTNGKFVKTNSSKGNSKTVTFLDKLMHTGEKVVDVTKLEPCPIRVSEKAQQILNDFIDSKKEKKLIRNKKLREQIAAKKMKNKLRKQKNKAVKRFFSNEKEDCNCPPSIPSKFNTAATSFQTGKKLRWRNLHPQCSHQQPTISNKKSSKNKRKRKNKKQVSLVNNQNMPDHKSMLPTDKAVPIQGLARNINVSPKTIANTPDSKSNSSQKWDAKEPAADFIPLLRRDSPKKSEDFRPLDKRKNTEYFNSPLENNNSSEFQQYQNDFVGISQKAYYLKC